MSATTKIALVTGASRGIGQAIALTLGHQGITVIATSTSQAGVHHINTVFHDNKIKGEGCVLDVTDEQSIADVLSHIQSNHGSVSILVNNAGITQDNLLLRMKPQQWHSVVNTNLNSAYVMTKPCLKPMIKAKWGRIINISSVVAASGNPGQVNYCASKAGLIGFTKALAQELAPFAVTVNAVAPGFIATDMTEKLNEQQKQAIESQIPMRRIGTVDEVAQVVCFLASDQASYITGQTLHVNGGLFCQ